MVGEALRAADELASAGVETRVLDCHTIKPIDHEAIVASADLAEEAPFLLPAQAGRDGQPRRGAAAAALLGGAHAISPVLRMCIAGRIDPCLIEMTLLWPPAQGEIGVNRLAAPAGAR